MKDINFDELFVGQVIKGIDDPVYPHLTVIGDRGSIRDNDGRIRAEYTVIKTYRDPFTNEVKKDDIQITRVYPKDSEYLTDSEAEE